ncbi:reverse transcriptase-like protein [Sphingomonas sp. RP10(2022)]|uniref:Reverse transcriptase-like protein n=1 Tax=Sphingomonas liriopis TaxID=2949094 RepID=A0A9X2HQR9_9SPHN|nr:reverse transcriptase-like protein [Sphingomonas liriopis]MCP3734747.1 reverse transcriptase-like protein [Sphingomonas liriopis]
MTVPFGEGETIARQAPARSARMTLHFDGGARPNPGRMEIAVVTGGRAHIRDDVGEGDNCTAEWMALRYAVEIALAAGARDVLLVGDARTIVEQALGNWRCRSPQLQPHLAAYRAAIAGIARVHVRHVPRSKNLAGIALAARHPRG